MRIKGALHVHSRLSHDGTMGVAELAHWYRRKAYQFLAIAEHAEDLDDAKVQLLREQAALNSNHRFCVVPGIEFAVSSTVHIVGVGATALIREKDPVMVVQRIHEQGGFAILAHPRRMRWECAPDVLRAVDAAEIWNVGCDGKYLPSPLALNAFGRMRRVNPALLAVASHDLHRKASFYDVGIEMNVGALAADAVLDELRQGNFSIESRFFRADSTARSSKISEFSFPFLSAQLQRIRKVRSLLLRCSS
jgi:hypothetical protein